MRQENLIGRELSLRTEVLDIIRNSASMNGVTVEDVLGKSRKKDIVTARFIAIYVCRTVFDEYSVNLISRMFNHKNHSSVIHAYKAVKDWMDIYPKAKEIVRELEEKSLYGSMTLPSRFSMSNSI